MLRRSFLEQLAGASSACALQALLPAWARAATDHRATSPLALTGDTVDLVVEQRRAAIAGRVARHITINNQFPAPLLRWREGDTLRLRVRNALEDSTSIHWHGILLPADMDGVPGVSFAGIGPGKTFEYQFTLGQSGTYWYHSHSGLQEQIGHYGPIVIDPSEPEPYRVEREYVVMLSDWSFESPARIFARLKKMSDSYNFQRRTLVDLLHDIRAHGISGALSDRARWGAMRMDPTDLADVTGATYTYLVNGHSPEENWTALFHPGETVRLRFINAAAMSIFNVRIPDLPMTVIQADGVPVQPVETDEFQLGTAETYDVLVRPAEARAYTIMAETNDFFAYARATLSPQPGMQAEVPALRQRPLLTMRDMGMAHAHESPQPTPSSGTGISHPEHAEHHERAAHDQVEGAPGTLQQKDETSAESQDQQHPHRHEVGVVNLAQAPASRLHERPLGLEHEPHRVLVYADLRSLVASAPARPADEELELHLTGNMARYMWSFDGLKFSEIEAPIPLRKGSRTRLHFVNDTMMPHPVHLHGMYFELVNGAGAAQPRKHTLVIKPGEKVAVDINVEAPGRWAFHCHLLYHMHAGMMRVFEVT